MRLVLLANSNSQRTSQLRASLAGRFPALQVELVPWAQVIEQTVDLRDIVRDGDIVRIDSPGKDFQVERLLLRAGVCQSTDARTMQTAGASPAMLDALREERGRVLWPAQWYRGFCTVLDRVRQQLADCPAHRLMNDPADIQLMFDKVRTHAALHAAGVSVAGAIGSVRCFDELISRMRSQGCSRVFVKLAYASSASGAVAIRTSGDRMQAFTTVELEGQDADGHPRAYNTRRIRELRSPAEIAAVVNEVCRHGVHVERWLPKAGIDGRICDMRVVVIAGAACHTVVRLSETPITNLNLLSKRGEGDLVRERCGESAWSAALNACERAASIVPGSLYAGVDILFSPDFRRHAVLEINAFGDQLDGVRWRGMDTYEAEMRIVTGAAAAAAAEVA